jgi:hypothetical protein
MGDGEQKYTLFGTVRLYWSFSSTLERYAFVVEFEMQRISIALNGEVAPNPSSK